MPKQNVILMFGVIVMSLSMQQQVYAENYISVIQVKNENRSTIKAVIKTIGSFILKDLQPEDYFVLLDTEGKKLCSIAPEDRSFVYDQEKINTIKKLPLIHSKYFDKVNKDSKGTNRIDVVEAVHAAKKWLKNDQQNIVIFFSDFQHMGRKNDFHGGVPADGFIFSNSSAFSHLRKPSGDYDVKVFVFINNKQSLVVLNGLGRFMHHVFEKKLGWQLFYFDRLSGNIGGTLSMSRPIADFSGVPLADENAPLTIQTEESIYFMPTVVTVIWNEPNTDIDIHLQFVSGEIINFHNGVVDKYFTTFSRTDNKEVIQGKFDVSKDIAFIRLHLVKGKRATGVVSLTESNGAQYSKKFSFYGNGEASQNEVYSNKSVNWIDIDLNSII